MDLTVLSQALAAAGVISVERDSFFNQTTLLLHGDGTNGTQNQTFLDSSTNTFTITRNGNTTQGTFSPFSLPNGEFSNYFDGTGDYLTVPAGAFAFSTGDYTVECFVYLNSLPAASSFYFIYDARSGATPTNHFVSIDSSGFIRYRNDGVTTTTTEAIQTNAWTHIAQARSGTTLKTFVNGVEVASTSSTSNLSIGSAVKIGNSIDNVYYLNGYISNFRTVIGSAVYTSAFTSPTAPLTAIANTSLLTCQSNRFVDNSSNAFALTVTSTPSVQPFSPFAPSAAYDPSVNGGSGYFDGTGDSLSIPYDADSDLATGSFTVEGWIYPLSWSGYPCMIFWGDGGSNYGQVYIAIDEASGGIYAYSGNGPTTGWHIQLDGGVATLNAWTHVAYIRRQDFGDAFLYVNGVQVDTVSGKTNDLRTATGSNYIGSRVTTLPWNGYISAVRVTKSVVYSSAFTPPTSPPTPVTNTEFLANFTNAGIFDNTGKNNLETVGNAQIDTSVKKYGTGSMEFDGTGDWLVSPSNSLYDLNGDFTIEFWIYLNSLSGNPTPIDRGYTGSGLDSSGYLIQYGSSALKFYGGGSSITSSQTDSTSTWFHYAIVRSGSTITMYRNGTSVGSETISTAFTYARELSIGGNSRAGAGFTAGQGAMNGYIDDLRITKGVARYLTTFTPPDAPFPDQ